MDNETLLKIEEVNNVSIRNKCYHSEKARLGVTQILNQLMGGSFYDGYKVTTDKHTYHVLIDNGQCCCESWGYLSSDDDLTKFEGKHLARVELTDKSLNKKVVDESDYYDGAGGVQFVDFCMVDGSVLQLAVYNAHNGYYGHPIFITKDDDILYQETL